MLGEKVVEDRKLAGLVESSWNPVGTVQPNLEGAMFGALWLPAHEFDPAAHDHDEALDRNWVQARFPLSSCITALFSKPRVEMSKTLVQAQTKTALWELTALSWCTGSPAVVGTSSRIMPLHLRENPDA